MQEKKQQQNANHFSSHSFAASHLIPLDSLPLSHREFYFSYCGVPHTDKKEDGKTLRGKELPSDVFARCGLRWNCCLKLRMNVRTACRWATGNPLSVFLSVQKHGSRKCPYRIQISFRSVLLQERGIRKNPQRWHIPVSAWWRWRSATRGQRFGKKVFPRHLYRRCRNLPAIDSFLDS